MTTAGGLDLRSIFTPLAATSSASRACCCSRFATADLTRRLWWWRPPPTGYHQLHGTGGCVIISAPLPPFGRAKDRFSSEWMNAFCIYVCVCVRRVKNLWPNWKINFKFTTVLLSIASSPHAGTFFICLGSGNRQPARVAHKWVALNFRVMCARTLLHAVCHLGCETCRWMVRRRFLGRFWMRR